MHVGKIRTSNKMPTLMCNKCGSTQLAATEEQGQRLNGMKCSSGCGGRYRFTGRLTQSVVNK